MPGYRQCCHRSEGNVTVSCRSVMGVSRIRPEMPLVPCLQFDRVHGSRPSVILARGVGGLVVNAMILPLGRFAHRFPLIPTAIGQPIKRPVVQFRFNKTFPTLFPTGRTLRAAGHCER